MKQLQSAAPSRMMMYDEIVYYIHSDQINARQPCNSCSSVLSATQQGVKLPQDEPLVQIPKHFYSATHSALYAVARRRSVCITRARQLLRWAIVPEQSGPKSGEAAVPRYVRELCPHLSQCRLRRGLPPYRVASWSIQPFGHNTPTLQVKQTDSGSIA